MKVRFKREELASLIDAGALFSCIRRDVLKQLTELSPGEGLGCEIKETV